MPKINDNPLPIEHRKMLIQNAATESVLPIAADAEMLAIEVNGLRAIVELMKELSDKIRPEEPLAAVWSDRIARFEAQAAVSAMLITAASEKANVIFSKRDDMIADLDLEASITPGITQTGDVH